MYKKIAIRISASVRAVFPLWDTCDLLLLGSFIHAPKFPLMIAASAKEGNYA